MAYPLKMAYLRAKKYDFALKILLLDNFDSFTYNLYDYLLQLGAEVMVRRNNELEPEDIKSWNIEALVLSPGPCKPSEAGIMPAVIERWHKELPILGICLGHQGLAEFFGAEVLKAKLPMHGKTSFIEHDGLELFEDIPNPMEVMRYHSLIVKDLTNTPLQVTARTSEGEIMAFRHNTLPIHGVQFHPESILTPQGMDMLRNWYQTL